ncbi:MAG: BrnT family toxin [Verrucomicrobiota bacterium]
MKKLKFEWDPKKAASNLAKHHVSFEEAKSVFLDPEALFIPDPEHSST